MEPAFVFGWFIVVFVLVITAVGASSKRMMGDKKIRNLQAKAALQVFGLFGTLIFAIGVLLYGGHLSDPANVVGVSALAYAAFSKYSPVNNALSFLTIAYRTEFAIDDWIRVSNTAGNIVGKVKDFNLKGVKVKTFDMSESIISCEELIHSFVENLTPGEIFRWMTVLSISKAASIKSIENICRKVLDENNLSSIMDEEGYQQDAYVEFHDDQLQFKPSFRRVSIFTYHPKWITMTESSEPIGYEVAYALARQFKRDILSELDSQQMTYVDASYVVKP
jgi:small-conductance mechanosensitive channel|tara:strand:+ start:486 stop:1319 length:834 start_codon:yes stop_codon:yes gene_type:complete